MSELVVFLIRTGFRSFDRHMARPVFIICLAFFLKFPHLLRPCSDPVLEQESPANSPLPTSPLGDPTQLRRGPGHKGAGAAGDELARWCGFFQQVLTKLGGDSVTKLGHVSDRRIHTLCRRSCALACCWDGGEAG
eukprot:gene18101-biopygen8380